MVDLVWDLELMLDLLPCEFEIFLPVLEVLRHESLDQDHRELQILHRLRVGSRVLRTPLRFNLLADFLEVQRAWLLGQLPRTDSKVDLLVDCMHQRPEHQTQRTLSRGPPIEEQPGPLTTILPCRKKGEGHTVSLWVVERVRHLLHRDDGFPTDLLDSNLHATSA